jgi:hypothetical protein
MSLNKLYDFIQILNSIRKHPTNNECFPMHVLFSTNYLLREQKLNHGNYSDQKLNMENFVQYNEYDAHMYAKVQDVCKYRYFYMNLTLFFLFSMYIVYYYETILMWMGYRRKIFIGIFVNIKDVMGSNTSKI